MRVKISKHIVIDSEICHGKPTFKGTRIMVWQVLEMLESEASIKEILKAFPSLSEEHIKAALHYAANLTRGRDNVILPIPVEA
ncbi:MAG TPA: antitoxin [Methanophagales archaeon]|nr:antitoxin [Methanophagales archaeon]